MGGEDLAGMEGLGGGVAIIMEAFGMHNTKFDIRIEIFEEDNQYVALSPELNVSSFGQSIERMPKPPWLRRLKPL